MLIRPIYLLNSIFIKKNVFKCVLAINCIQNQKKALFNGDFFRINVLTILLFMLRYLEILKLIYHLYSG